MGIVVNHGNQTSDMAPSISEYTQRISKVIDEEVGKAKKLAEQEASQVITEARQQAQQITEEAMTKAEEESARYMTELRQKAEQTAARLEEEARSKAEAESAAIVARSFEEAEQILAKARQAAKHEAIEQGKKEASEVRSKVLKEFEECVRVINEAKQKFEQALDVAEEGTGKESGQLSEACVQPHFVEGQVKVGEPMVQAEVSLAAVAAGDTEPYQGEVELEVTSDGDYGQVGRFTECLCKVPNIELESLGSFVQGKITAIIGVTEPFPLVSFIKEMPLVEGVVEQENRINVVLKRAHE